jgi:hypothetical protein
MLDPDPDSMNPDLQLWFKKDVFRCFSPTIRTKSVFGLQTAWNFSLLNILAGVFRGLVHFSTFGATCR